MGGRNGNVWARIAAWFTMVAHVRAPLVRWGALALLASVWLWAGYNGWMLQDGGEDQVVTRQDAIYRTIGALTVQGDYSSVSNNSHLELARFAGLAVPLVGLIFAFSGQLGRSLAQLFHGGAADHVVIAGEGLAALCLARSCVRADDVVVVIGRSFPEETLWALRKAGVMVIEGDPANLDALRSARAAAAAHVVALVEDDTANLRIEAGVRAYAARRPRKRPLTVHVGLRSPVLLQEAREMRRLMQAAPDAPPPASPPVEARPFSLDEIAARLLLQHEGPTILTVGERQRHARPHLVVFGFDDAAEAVAVRVLMGLWSVRFDDPCVTVVTPDAQSARERFEARYPQARAHDVWKADIEFQSFDWRGRAIDEATLEAIAATRGAATAIVVSTGADADNIALALGVQRACNAGLAHADGTALWPSPIYLKEVSESEFSRQFAAGDRTPDVDDAYIQAFGAYEQVATRALIIDGALDQGAAMAHDFYQRGAARRADVALRELEAVRRSWSDVGETYRNANRASADHAVLKLWDAGWIPADRDGEAEAAAPVIAEEQIAKLARREHDRWTAERLLAGWRPGEKRNNRLMIHPNITAWDNLTPAEQDKDADQVRAAVTLARALHTQGFKRRAEA